MTRSERIEAALREMVPWVHSLVNDNLYLDPAKGWSLLREARAALASPPAPAEGEREAGFREGVEAAARWVEGQMSAPHFTPQLRLVLADAIRGLAAPRPPSSPPSSPPCVPCAEGIGTGVPHTCQRRPPPSPDPAREAVRDGQRHMASAALTDASLARAAPSPDPGARPAEEGPRRCACGHRLDDHGQQPTDRILRPAWIAPPNCRRIGCQCERFSERAPRLPPAPSPAAVEAPRRERCACGHTHCVGEDGTPDPVCDQWGEEDADCSCTDFAAQPQTKEGAP